MRKTILQITVLVFTLAMAVACQAMDQGSQPKKTGTIPKSPTVQGEVILSGLSCPESFQERDLIQKEVRLRSSGTLTLEFGSTPSMPCSWRSPHIGDRTLITQSDHYTKWPADGSTPQPGAPGEEIWDFKTSKAGQTDITLPCHCLNEEGSEEVMEGRLVIQIQVEN